MSGDVTWDIEDAYRKQRMTDAKEHRNTRHGHAKGARRTRTYSSWCSMRVRCMSPAHYQFDRYGGRGITICERWDDFRNFLADMGERPVGRTLDRIDTNGNYEPGNCRWATDTEQQRSRTDSKLNGEAIKVIRIAGSTGRRKRLLGRLYGVSETMVRHVVCGREWVGA